MLFGAQQAKINYGTNILKDDDPNFNKVFNTVVVAALFEFSVALLAWSPIT